MKKVVLISSALLTFVIGIYFYYYSDSQKYVLESESGSNQKIVSSNSLTMMYETEYQSGEYQVSSDSVWPESGYIFNENLSKCENGGRLTWDDVNKKVLLQTNTSDKCFVYFDYSLLISFSIESSPGNTIDYYNAEREMTWNEWINSEYNVSGYVIYNGNYVSRKASCLSIGNVGYVSVSDLIIANQNYFINTDAICPM